MLKVKTKLGISPIAGVGLFADEFIPKDTIIWGFTPGMDRWFPEDEFKSQESPIKEFLTKYCYKFNGKYYLCVDNARFFNHSDNPNCYSSDVSEFNLGYTRAKRDIQIGEELLDDYSGFGWNEDDKKFNMSL